MTQLHYYHGYGRKEGHNGHRMTSDSHRHHGDRIHNVNWKSHSIDYGNSYDVGWKWFSIGLLLASLCSCLHSVVLKSAPVPSPKQTARQLDPLIPSQARTQKGLRKNLMDAHPALDSMESYRSYSFRSTYGRDNVSPNYEEFDLTHRAIQTETEEAETISSGEESTDDSQEITTTTSASPWSNAYNIETDWLNVPNTGSVVSDGTRLRSILLDGYDKYSFPFEWAWEQEVEEEMEDGATNSSSSNLRSGVPIEIGINIHKAHKLEIAESTLDLSVWFRIAWYDPRLTWNPDDFGGVKSLFFYVSDGNGGEGSSEIWTPDIYVWNAAESITDTLDNTNAIVTSDGRAFWSRPGRIHSICQYEGLKDFPFDKLSCKLEVGSWSHSGLYIRPAKLETSSGDGLSFGGSDTSGTYHGEFRIDQKLSNVERIVYPPFPGVPEEDWPVLIYQIYFDRASGPYMRGVILTNMLLNLAAFCSFWIPPHVGERIGLAITCVLSAVAGELVFSSMLLVDENVSWYNIFMMTSTAFALAVVFESAVVIYFFYYTEDDLVPTWARCLIDRFNGKPAVEPVVESGEGNQLNAADEIARNDGDSNEDGNVDRPSSEEEEEEEELLKNGFSPGPKSVNLHHEWRVRAGNFKSEQEAINNDYWQKIAGRVDEVCRVVFPLAYFIFLGWILSIRHGP